MILRHFMIHLADRYACAPLSISPRLVEACENYPWPGNIRELENFVKRYLVLGDESAAIGELQHGTSRDPQTGVVVRMEEKQPQPPARPQGNGSQSEERRRDGSDRPSAGRNRVEP